MSVSMTLGGTVIDSAAAMEARRVEVEVESRGLKRNLEQREARGSIILHELSAHALLEVWLDRTQLLTESRSCTPDRTALFVRSSP